MATYRQSDGTPHPPPSISAYPEHTRFEFVSRASSIGDIREAWRRLITICAGLIYNPHYSILKDKIMPYKLLLLHAATIMTFLVGSDAHAFEFSCSHDSVKGGWKEGIFNHKAVDNIVNKFTPEHQQLVTFLDGLPVKTDLSTIQKGIGIQPTSKVSVVKDWFRVEWHIPGANSSLDVIIQDFNGCISYITLGEEKNEGGTSYFRRTNKLQ